MTTFSEPLASLAHRNLQEAFAAYGHEPSDRMWEALRDVLNTLSDMAERRADPKVYLSSLDPGVGKTETVVKFLQALVTSRDHADVGAMVCVSRLDEIRALVTTARLPKGTFGVLTSDPELNGLGNDVPETGQVLFTTQQMIEKRCAGKALADTDGLSFQGKPRAVRVWDESLLPAHPVTVARDSVRHLAIAFRSPVSSKLSDDLDRFADQMEAAEDGAALVVPDIPGHHKLSRWGFLRGLQDQPEHLRESAEELWDLSGQKVSVRWDGGLGPALVSFREHLPEDLAPLLVLDASGRVRRTYKLWERHRSSLSRLTEAPKDYSNLTIHIWDKGGGKTSFLDNERRPRLIQGIAHTIAEKPDEEWLVVAHKDVNDLREALYGHLQTATDNIHIITWGNHHAWNAFSHVQNVILAGVQSFRPSMYEAIWRAASGCRADERGFSDDHDLSSLAQAERCHGALQALCRASVRKAVGDGCGPCDAYVIATSRSGLPAALSEVFPGHSVESWRPVRNELTGRVRQAADYLLQEYDRLLHGLVKIKDVRDATGQSPQNFRKNVLQHPDFQGFLDERGILVSPKVPKAPKWPSGQPRYFTSSNYYWFGPEGADDTDIDPDPVLEPYR